MKSKLPAIRLAAKPVGLTFKTPKAALEKWKALHLAAAAPAAGEISIMNEIGDDGWGGDCTTAGSIKAQLAVLKGAPVTVLLNSPGGDAFEGIAIYNLFRAHPGTVTMKVLGLAASAASVIAMAGDKVEMGEASVLMIHSAWGVVMGNKADMVQFADVLDTLDTSVAELYARRSGMPLADVKAMMDAETWMSGQEAVDSGFADSCAPPAKTRGARAAFAKPVFSAQTPAALLAAPGNRHAVARLSASTPGASGTQSNPKGTEMQTLNERIASFEAKRAASAARMEAIMAKAGDEGRTLDETETQEYDTLTGEVEAVDQHLVRMKKQEALMVARAAPIRAAVVNDRSAGDTVHANSGIVMVAPNVEKGIAFTRYAIAQMRARGNMTHALSIAQNNKQWMDQTPEVAKVLMAAVAGGDTLTAGWASELVYPSNLVSDFIEVLRPKTVLGRIPGLTMVPFNVRVAGADSGTSANWVGQGKPAPVSKMHTIAVTLGIAKAAGLVVLTQELIRSSSPSAETMVRNDMVKAMAQFLDQQFLSPDYAAVANVSPASMTSGVTPLAATGTTSAALRADVQTLFGTWIAANLDPTGGVWIMPATTALSISLMLNALGQPVFPGITMNGGTFFGLPVITSQSAVKVGSPVSGEGNMIILLNAPEVFLADDGQVTIDASAEASIQMLDNPTNDAAAGTPTTLVSMFQDNSVALRATRFINWAKRRSTACQFIEDSQYVT